MVKVESSGTSTPWELALATVMFGSAFVYELVKVSEFSQRWQTNIDGLEPGWIMNRKMDLFDDQWRSFRSGLPLLLLFALVQSGLGFITRRKSQRNHVMLQMCTGFIFVYILHGYRLLFTLAITLLNFSLTKVFKSRQLVVITWIFNLTVLVVVSSVGESWELPYLSFRGMSGWSHMFNMLMLKQISFGVDAAHKSSSKTSLLYYLGYCFYSPLFLAGPIVSYSSWVENLGTSKLSRKYIGLYGLRWVLTFLLLELFLHLSYANAISAQRSLALDQVDSLSLGVSLSVAVLLFMWLKFLLIWRFFRFWSLLNGIDCPENMNRCVLNNYSMVQFWKDWHSSFNLWLIKYVYIPLGGSRRNRLLNILIVFTFVALWHDLTWRVFHWAFLVVAIMAPELVCTAIYRTHMKRFRQRFPLLGKIVKSVFATFNTQMLVLANMVGYVFGLEGVQTLLSNIKAYNVTEIAGVFFALYGAVTWMLWLDERRLSLQKASSSSGDVQ